MDQSGLFVNLLYSVLNRKITVPSQFKQQAEAVEEMLQNDVSGLVDSLTDFAINSANVKYRIDTGSSKYTEILNTWLKTINASYNGQLPIGVEALAEEYFRERWKGASFPILKITSWKRISGVLVPDGLIFCNGGSVRAKDKDVDSTNAQLLGYDYVLGEAQEPLDKGVLITKPFTRWYAKYPVPFLIKRGIYHNWRIIRSLKDKEGELLEAVLPYLLLIKKGSEDLALQGKKIYSDDDFKKVKETVQELLDKVNQGKAGLQTDTPTRVTSFDEEFTQLIPDIEALFKPGLFAVAEKAIMAGLGLVEMGEGINSNRKEAILNPKVFIAEVEKGVIDFVRILENLMALVLENNAEEHRIYVNSGYTITHTPIKTFLTKDFMDTLRACYDRGALSKQTYNEYVVANGFDVEVSRREKEAREGTDATMYPQVIMNIEGKGVDLYDDFFKENPEDTTQENVPDDRKGTEANNFNQSDVLEIAPYKDSSELPTKIKNVLSKQLQGVFVTVFNSAYQTYDQYDKTRRETLAFKVAWGQIKRLGNKNNLGVWQIKSEVRKAIKDLQKSSKTKIDPVNQLLEITKLEIAEKQSKLLDKLNGEKDA